MEKPLDELRALIVSGDPINEPYCRRLALRATRTISDPQRAAKLLDDLGLAMAFHPVFPTDTRNAVLAVLDEIEEAGRPNKTLL